MPSKDKARTTKLFAIYRDEIRVIDELTNNASAYLHKLMWSDPDFKRLARKLGVRKRKLPQRGGARK